jgi:putative DNA modification/repair radical SAM protein
MERLVRVAKKLRLEHRFNGYIHLKTIPGASNELMNEAGLYADRLSVNIELPTERGLKLLAPDKTFASMEKPMDFISNTITALNDTRKLLLSTPKFAPAGQSTQVIIGATDESDLEIIRTADRFYRGFNLKRVYYSGYVPVLSDKRLPALSAQVPMLRENRLNQADWLMRFYGFGAHEIVDDHQPNLDLDIDPKFGWALRNLHLFPLDINKADLHMILRVPGIGVRSAQKIVAARKFGRLGWENLRKLGISLNRARYFIVCKDPALETKEYAPETLRHLVLSSGKSKFSDLWGTQTSLFG